jgi:hypothetical protein
MSCATTAQQKELEAVPEKRAGAPKWPELSDTCLGLNGNY